MDSSDKGRFRSTVPASTAGQQLDALHDVIDGIEMKTCRQQLRMSTF
jgi:hypothetical protein